ncbi:MAG TPA: hypothetical protein VK716_11230 [Terracidiphilus sp.]|jgi:hypothetical protein|nr:hypothetical protein [Terracidiphilus sp.]
MKALRVLRIMGMFLFAVAFFLPAVHINESPSMDVYGWNCCFSTIFFSILGIGGLAKAGAQAAPNAFIFLLSASASPLVGAYFLSMRSSLMLLRGVLCIGIVAGVAASSVVISQLNMTPLVGHFVWMAGIALLLIVEAIEEAHARLERHNDDVSSLKL